MARKRIDIIIRTKKAGTLLPDFKMNMWPCSVHPDSTADLNGICRGCQKSYQRKRRDRYGYSLKDKYSSARTTARLRDIAFTLTLSEFEAITSQPCVYAVQSQDGIRSGIDRKDNDVGYTIENSVPCCYRHNRIKSNLFTFEEMMDIARRCKGVQACGNAVGKKRVKRTDPAK